MNDLYLSVSFNYLFNLIKENMNEERLGVLNILCFLCDECNY